MSRILLTGGSGFIGNRLSEVLQARGYDVTRTSSAQTSEGLVQCDLRDSEAVSRVVRDANPDIVIHCAAISSVTSNRGLDYYATNVIGTENLLTAITNLKQRVRFLFASTAGVYGNQSAAFLSEDMHALPVHHYGVSKFACEQIIRNFVDRLDFTIVRPFNIIGAAQTKTFVVPKVVMAFARAQPRILLGNIDVFRDYIELETACTIFVELLENNASIGETVNLCSGRSTSLRDLIDIVQHIAGYEIEIEQAPHFTRSAEVWRLVGNRDKLDRLISDKIVFRPLRESLLDILETYRAELQRSV